MSDVGFCTRFAAKEKLYKCIAQCQEAFGVPFRQSDITKWLENYFKREGGHMESVGVFLQFIQNLGIVSRVEQSVLNSKYFFNEERIRELFLDSHRTTALTENINCVNTISHQRTLTDQETVSETSNDVVFLPGDSSKIPRSNDYESEIWFEEITTRLACLLDMDRQELVAYLQASEYDGTVSGAAKENKPLLAVNLGSYAKFNCMVLNSNRQFDQLSNRDYMVDAVTLACFDTLAKWPKGHDHQPDLCEGLCVPHLILSTAFACAQGELADTNTLPKAVASLLELIIQSWPPADLSSTIQNLWNDVTTTFLSNVVMTNSYPSDLPIQELPFPSTAKTDSEETEECQKSTALSLPPLATPSVDKTIPFADDSRYFSCQKIQRSRIMSVHIPTFDLNDFTDSDYKPISPDLQFYKRNSGHAPFTAPITESASITSNASSHTCSIDLNREERTAQSLFQPVHPVAFFQSVH
ncbi:hypothetical protein AHF37_03133 [Paragonimus kellicotti]|nr:hypothetical protein AHF37_03133 [Paragonimus kellicotti]